MTKKASSLRKRAIIAVIALVLLLAILTVLEKTHVTNFIKLHKNTPVQNGPTAEQKQQEDAADTAQKQKFIESTDNSSGSATSDQSKSINLSAQQGNSASVTVFTKAYGYSDGTCSLVVTNQGRQTTQSAVLAYQPEYSSCAGFSVPVEPLGKGTWTIKLTITSAGASTDKTITYEVK